ncbi:hypothetical protein J5N97_008438 [Dioscorea zingiberensis]|uniref:Uncharacterized protein n=1 Tax=Dioscorea zingiberensis TaxID=325984 RepID=A0A9D5CXH7_9LILI|nr:hypothetical protein J5N97_008438 [Dioscorea zingiberensis]
MFRCMNLAKSVIKSWSVSAEGLIQAETSAIQSQQLARSITLGTGMSQPHSTQQQFGLKDIQLWQQHLMYKQLKEIHRQKQLQQIHQDAKQQNSLSQLYGVTPQKLANQLPSIPPGMATNKASTYLWPNEMMGCYTKAPPNPQMVIPGIMNYAQHSGAPVMHGLPDGLSFQAIQSTGPLPQWLDQSLCGNPVPTARASMENRFQFEGMSQMSYMDGNQAEKAPLQSSDFSHSEQHGLQSCSQNDSLVSKEGFKEKNFFRNSPVQSLNSGSGSVSIQLANNEDLQGREQADWPGYLQENLVSQVKPSSVAANLDQNKDRLLSSKGDGCWDASFKSGNIGTEGSLYGNYSDNNEYSSACPSIQSGSWSALMQEALGASSSDMGVQEDWSDLTFQNAELSSGSHSAILNDNTRQQNNWENNSLQGSSSLTSRPFPFFSDADESPNSFPTPSAEQSSMKNSYEHDEGMLPNNAHDSFRQETEQMNNNQLYQSHHQNQCLGHSIQAHIQDTKLLSGVQAGQIDVLSGNDANSLKMEFNAQNTSGIWAQTKKNQFHCVGGQLNERPQPPHGWILNSTDGLELVKSAGGSSEMSIQDPDANHFVPLIISNGSEMNRKMNEAIDLVHVNCGRYAAIDSSNRYSTEYQHQTSLGQQASHALLNRTAKDTGVSYENGEGCVGNSDSSFTGKPSSLLLSCSQRSSGQSVWKSPPPRSFQHHTMGELEMIHGDSQNQRPYSKVSSQSFALSSGSQDQGYVDHLCFPGPVNLSNAVNIRKEHMTDSETERIQSTRAVASHASTYIALDRSTTAFSQEKSISQTSQNMPELLHKVDQSRESTGATYFCSSGSKRPSGLPASASPNSVVSNILHDQPSASRDFMLGLATPLQGQPFSNHSFPLWSSHTIAGNRVQQTPSANITALSASQAHDASQSVLYSTPLASPTLPHVVSQQLQQGIYSSSYLAVEAHPKSLSLEGHHNYNTHVRQTEDLPDKPFADQSSQALFAATSSRNSYGNLSSQFYSLDKGHPQPINSTYQTTLVSKPSVTTSSGGAGGLSKMMHGVSTTPSDQQCLSRVQPQNISNLVQLQGALLQSGEANLFQQMVDYQSCKKGASAPSGSYSTSSQHANFEEHNKHNSLQQIPSSKEVDIPSSTGPASQMQETRLKYGNPRVSVSYLVHPHQQDLSKRKHILESSLLSRMQHLPVPNVFSSNNERQTFEQIQEPPDIKKENSLLQQMQRTNGVTSDLSGRIGKRLKGSNIDDDARQIDLRTVHCNAYEQNTGFKLPTEGDQETISKQNSLFSRLQMLRFSSREIEEKGVNESSKFGSEDMPSQDLLASRQQNSENNTQFLSVRSASSSLGESKGHQTNPQITPALTDQNGAYRNGQIFVRDGLNSTEWSSKTDAKNGVFKKDPKSMNFNNLAEQGGDACQGGGFSQSTQSVIPPAMASPNCQHLDAAGHPVVLQQKKRKRGAPEFLPWHKELTQGSRRLCSISMTETNWAKTTNRLVEKVMMIEDGPLIPRPRKRLILTTQLMQNVIMSVPAVIIKENIFTSYEDVVYHVAKLALGDACSLISFLGNDSSVHLDSRNMLKTCQKEGDHALSKIMKVFFDKSRKLGSDLFRLENRVSISDVRMEFQDLERCSIIHRFAKFHGCSQTDGLETSLTSNVPPRTFLQRQVTAIPMPARHPEGVLCLSL